MYVFAGKEAWCSLEEYQGMRERFCAITFFPDINVMKKRFLEYNRFFLDTWLPDKPAVWNAYRNHPNPLFAVVLEIYKSK